MSGVGNGNGHGAAPSSPRGLLRCAVYTRKSTEEGLDQDFNSLDAQREACESFIASQRGEGWVLVPDRFDDGGFTGANIERPALKRLLAEIEAGRVEIVVVYKLDRLTRSIRDFGRLMDVFEKYNVAFVSVSQRFDTTSSMGRLMLHVLLSFAQFEREMTAERTRDKMLAARRKGKWTGGYPPLGYDLAENGSKLVVNAAEAEQVRAIFDLYLERASLIATMEELNRRGWRSKSWQTKGNGHHEGRPWSKATLRRLLTNKVYLGLVPHKAEAYPGEHPAILDEETFERVQAVMSDGRTHGSAGTRNSFAYLLRGLVHCAVCGSAMSAATTKKGNTNYRYYRCTAVDKKGTTACPVRYAPAEPLEAFVIDHLRRLGREPALVEETLQQAHREIASGLARLKDEGKRLEADSRRVKAEARRVLSSKAAGSLATAHLANLEERQGAIATRLAEIDAESQRLAGIKVDPIETKSALATFDPVWDLLEPREKERLVRLVVERVDYNGVAGEIGLHFHPLGLQSLVAEDGVATKLKRVERTAKAIVAGEVA
ncbi:MAG TPA: recombinase family protein [Planctomycetota bacterium]|nr:recombinase family protein [Planctomycetota bacterium]